MTEFRSLRHLPGCGAPLCGWVCESVGRSRKPLGAVRSLVGSNPTPSATHLGDSMSAMERRIVAVMFTDLVRSTELFDRLSAERAEEVRRSHFDALREVVEASAG